MGSPAAGWAAGSAATLAAGLAEGLAQGLAASAQRAFSLLRWGPRELRWVVGVLAQRTCVLWGHSHASTHCQSAHR